jgi:TonB dependent receptor
VCFNEIFDPASQTTVNGQPVRLPFPNNVIPASRIDPTAAIIQNMIPLPNTVGLFNYTAPGYSDFRHTTIPSLKVDQLLTSKAKLSAYYSATRTESPQTNGFPQPWTTAIPQNILAQTTRINFDDTLTPTLLFHAGAGLMHLSDPSTNPPYNQAGLFPQGQPFYANYFPYISGTDGFPFGGGWSGAGFPGGVGSFFEDVSQVDIKPTFNASMTWVKGNHTFKLGATAIFDGIPTITAGRAQGEFEFAQTETADPWQSGMPFVNTASSGFGYASFFLGAADGLQVGQVADSRLGYHEYGIYLQDSWKVTRRLTLELGLRWDYANLWTEEHGRMQNAAFNLPNSLIGNRPGTVVYQATCGCNFATSYGLSLGPHLGVAYQISPKTVFRAGGAIAYGSEVDQAQLSASVADFYGVGAPAYGTPAAVLKNGNPYAPGNPFGNPPIVWPNFNPEFPFPAAPGVIPPSSPFISIDPGTGRLPRIFQWSIGLQRELARNLVVDAAYVGNRGAWWAAPLLAAQNYNAFTPQQLLSQYGLNVQNPADAALLNTPINSPAVIARFPYLANPNNVYPGFPATQTLRQAIRPYPQWDGIPPFLGPPMGDTWFDSLQVKVTKRFSHGLVLNSAFTWEKELTNGANSNTAYLTPDPPLINDVFNTALDKQISAFSLPFTFVVSYSYTTPRLNFTSGGGKALSWLLKDWTYSGVLRYQSGNLIQTPPSANNLLLNLDRGVDNNPAFWGGGTTFLDRVPGQPLFAPGIDPNCHCFDPSKQLVLNPNAWVEPAFGTFGTSAPYYNNYRWQRQPMESMGFGRIFRIKEGVTLQVRAEFYNIFNRVLYNAPSVGCAAFVGCVTTSTPTATMNNFANGQAGALSGGYGFVNTNNGALASPPRTGQLYARFQF